MREEELWKAYCEKENIDIDTPYEAWEFGDAPDKLADIMQRCCCFWMNFRNVENIWL